VQNTGFPYKNENTLQKTLFGFGKYYICEEIGIKTKPKNRSFL